MPRQGKKKVILSNFPYQRLGSSTNKTYICNHNLETQTLTMRISLFSFLAVLVLTFTSCASQYNIDGNSSLACLDGKKLYLRTKSYAQQSTHTINLDSCVVIHGRFSFGGNADSITLAEVYMEDQILMPVVIEGGELLMQVDNYGQTVTGGPLNERLTEFMQRRLRYSSELWELERKARKLLFSGVPIERVEAQFAPKRDAIVQKIEDLEVKFVLDNHNNALGTGYFMQLADQLGFPTMSAQLRRIVEKAPASFLRNPQVSNYLFLAGYTPTKQQKVRK